MKNVLIISSLLLFTLHLSAQARYFTRTGNITFFSSTPLEDIEAKNDQANAVIDFDKKELAFSALMKSFIFPKALMQTHFNENYVESDKYPKATFKGKYKGEVNKSKDGTYPVEIEGDLTLHGVTKTIQLPGTITIKSGKATAKAKFQVAPKDYNIKIPSVVSNKIAKTVDVTVDVILEPLKQ